MPSLNRLFRPKLQRQSYFLSMFLATAFAVAVPLLALQIYNMVRHKSIDVDAAVNLLKTRIDTAAAEADSSISRIEGMVRFLASRKELQTLDHERCATLIKGLASVDPLVANIGAVDLEGRLLCMSATPNAPKRSYKDAAWFAPALEKVKQGSWYFGKPYFGDVSRKLLLNIVGPLRDPSGRTIGMIAAAIDLNYFSKQILSSDNLPPGSGVALMDADGIVVARNPHLELYVGKPVPMHILAQAGSAGTTTFEAVSRDGFLARYAISRLNHYDLQVGAISPTAVIVAKSEQEFLRSAITLAVVAVLGLLAGLFAAKRLSEPLRSLARTARALASGETDVRADDRLPGEFHDLAVEFNAMIDARKNAELSRRAQMEAEAQSRAKSEFLANMSHEIRTPMNAIIGLTDLMLRTDLSLRQQDYLSKSKLAADSLLQLIDGILDFSKIEAGMLELDHREFSLEDVLSRVTAIVGSRAQQKGLRFVIDTDDAVPTRLIGDSQRLNQVLVNLCGNAVKFTATGEVSIRIKKLSAGSGNVTVRFSVSDSGIGMSTQEMEKLFRPFSQADASTSRQFGGTGLGLAISKQLVKLMGGTISVSSEPGRGSCFSFIVTFALANGEQHPEIALPSEDLELLHGLHVLLVEDNDINQMVASELLASLAGMRVTVAANGSRALDILKDQAVDIVLMDVQMPHMDGYETTRNIRRDPAFSRLPIIAMTAHATTVDRELCLESGMNDYISKPFDPQTLIAVVHKWIVTSYPRSFLSSR